MIQWSPLVRHYPPEKPPTFADKIKLAAGWTIWGIKALVVAPYFAVRIAKIAIYVAWDNYSPWGEFYKKKIVNGEVVDE